MDDAWVLERLQKGDVSGAVDGVYRLHARDLRCFLRSRLYSEDAVTLIKSTNGRPLPVPTANDTAEVASVVSEGGSESVVDIDSTGHQTLGAYTYRTPRFVASFEAFEDMEGALSTVNLLREFSADRLARAPPDGKDEAGARPRQRQRSLSRSSLGDDECGR